VFESRKASCVVNKKTEYKLQAQVKEKERVLRTKNYMTNSNTPKDNKVADYKELVGSHEQTKK